MRNFKLKYSNSRHYERDIEFGILVELNKVGFFWKVDYAGQLVNGVWRRNKSVFAVSGMPDIQGVINGYKPFFFEVKTPEEYKKIVKNWDKYKTAPFSASKNIKRYQRQILTIERLRNNGCVAEFIYNKDQALDFIKGGKINV